MENQQAETQQEEKPVVLSIKMVVPGVELVLAALSKLPYEQSAGLIQEIHGQAMYQLQTQQQPEADKAAESQPANEGE